MPRENEPGINPSNGHHQSPTSFGDSGFGESSFGDSVACSFPCGRLDHVKGPVLSTAFGSRDHCPTGCPRFGYRVRALRAGAMDAAPTAAAAAGGAGVDGVEDGGDRPDKSWVESYDPSQGDGEKKKRKRKRKKAKQGHQQKLKAIPPEPTHAPKPSPVVEDASRGSASATPGTFGRRDREFGYFNSQGDRVPRRRINQNGDLEVYREDGLVEVFPNAAADQQEDEEEEPEDDDEDGQDDQPGGGNPPGGGGGPPDRDPPGDGGGASGHQGPSGGDSSDENWGSQWTQKGKVAPEPEGELGVESKKTCFARYGDGSNGQSYEDAELYYQTLGECGVCSATSAWR